MIKLDDVKKGIRVNYTVDGDKRFIIVTEVFKKTVHFKGMDGTDYDDEIKTFVSNINFHGGQIEVPPAATNSGEYGMSYEQLEAA